MSVRKERDVACSFRSLRVPLVLEGAKVYPIVLTRELAQARQWLRDRARGSERVGLVASSGASRLKPEGVNVHEKIDAACGSE
jgi:schlafen family protein